MGDPLLPNDLLPRHGSLFLISKVFLLLTTYFLFQSDGKTLRKRSVVTETKVYIYISLMNVTNKGNRALVTKSFTIQRGNDRV